VSLTAAGRQRGEIEMLLSNTVQLLTVRFENVLSVDDEAVVVELLGVLDLPVRVTLC
jgi:hypothetical protein